MWLEHHPPSHHAQPSSPPCLSQFRLVEPPGGRKDSEGRNGRRGKVGKTRRKDDSPGPRRPEWARRRRTGPAAAVSVIELSSEGSRQVVTTAAVMTIDSGGDWLKRKTYRCLGAGPNGSRRAGAEEDQQRQTGLAESALRPHRSPHGMIGSIVDPRRAKVGGNGGITTAGMPHRQEEEKKVACDSRVPCDWGGLAASLGDGNHRRQWRLCPRRCDRWMRCYRCRNAYGEIGGRRGRSG